MAGCFSRKFEFDFEKSILSYLEKNKNEKPVYALFLVNGKNVLTPNDLFGTYKLTSEGEIITMTEGSLFEKKKTFYLNTNIKENVFFLILLKMI